MAYFDHCLPHDFLAHNFTKMYVPLIRCEGKKCSWSQSEETSGKSCSRSLRNSPVDPSELVFTNVHVFCLLKGNRKVFKWQDRERSFSKIYWLSQRRKGNYVLYRALLSQPDLECVERKTKVKRLISTLWLVVGRLVNKQINTTRLPRLYFILSCRSAQLSIYFWATGVNWQYKTYGGCAY